MQHHLLLVQRQAPVLAHLHAQGIHHLHGLAALGEVVVLAAKVEAGSGDVAGDPGVRGGPTVLHHQQGGGATGRQKT